jgi:hypothetical protein
MSALTRPGYRSIDTVTKELWGDYKDFAGESFTITAGDQPGWVTITYPGDAPWQAAYEPTCAAIDTELITRQEATA